MYYNYFRSFICCVPVFIAYYVSDRVFQLIFTNKINKTKKKLKIVIDEVMVTRERIICRTK